MRSGPSDSGRCSDDKSTAVLTIDPASSSIRIMAQAEAASELQTIVPLYRLAQARSGDKGDTADISIFLPTQELWAELDEQLKPERVAAFLAPLVHGEVQRYELPVLQGYKFVCHHALAGGGAASLRSDNLGKAIGSALLRLTVSVSPNLVVQSPLLGGPPKEAPS